MKKATGIINTKSIFKIAGTGAATALVCALLLFLTGMIPKSAIAESAIKSAEYFREHELFEYLIEDQFNTQQDNYADSILVNIMYHIDHENLPLSLIKASYYNPEMENVDVSLWDAVQDEKIPNVDYFRYWHGSMVLLRPLFMFTGIQGARLILGGILLVLILAVAALLFRQKERPLAISYLLANLIVQTWMCAFCIEYITTFLVMNAVSLVMIRLYSKWKQDQIKLDEKSLMLMSISGVTACFLDFLTTETLTVTIPLLILLVLRFREDKLESLGKEVRRMALHGVIWGVSYGCMFALKWGISAAVLGGSAFKEALSSVGERISGTVYLGNTTLDPTATGWQRFTGALIRNQGNLFPFRGEMEVGAAVAAFMGLLFLCFAIIYLCRDKNFSWKMIGLCAILALVPYLRYAALGNHSYMHYFFTYRAQLVTVTILLYCSWQFGLQIFWKKK